MLDLMTGEKIKIYVDRDMSSRGFDLQIIKENRSENKFSAAEINFKPIRENAAIPYALHFNFDEEDSLQQLIANINEFIQR